MRRAEIQQSLIELLRTCALSGSDRPVDPTIPLGGLGIGLDSLAMVQFLTAVESNYKIELPDDLWVTRESLSIDTFVEEILHQTPAPAVAPQVVIPQRELVTAHGPSALGSIGQLTSLGRKVFNQTYHKIKFHILVRDLSTPLPEFPLKHGLFFRRISAGDQVNLENFWIKEVREYKSQVFKKRLETDVVCLAVMDGDRVVAIDWFSHHRAVETELGLVVEMTPEVCYGYDLHEHPDYQSQGLGLALLSYTLKFAREMGYRKQYAIVHEHNHKMLSVSTQLMGMKKVGEIEVARVFRKPFPSWKLGELSGTRLLNFS